MPLTIMLSLCSICIITGIFLVLKAISMRSPGERSPGRHRESALNEDVEALADLEEAVPLQFLEEGQTRVRRISNASQPCPMESRRVEDPGDKGVSKRPPAFWNLLTAPFRALRQKEREPDGGTTLDEPASSGIVLNPRNPIKHAVPALKRNEP